MSNPLNPLSFEPLTLVTNDSILFINYSMKNFRITNQTKDFHLNSEAEVSFSYKPDKFIVKTEMGRDKQEKFFYKHNITKEGEKYNEWDVSYDKKSSQLELDIADRSTSHVRRIELKVDNIECPRSAQLDVKYGHESYNFSAIRVPKESISLNFVSTKSVLKAVIGRKIISNISLITPKINAQLTANPLSDKKTLVFKLESPRYDQNSNIEWVPRGYLKLDSLSHRKVDPEKKVKVDAYLTRDDESTFNMTAPSLDVNIRRVKIPKPRYIFNTTINGYNEVQEFESYPSLTPLQNLMVALNKYYKSYTSNN